MVLVLFFCAAVGTPSISRQPDVAPVVTEQGIVVRFGRNSVAVGGGQTLRIQVSTTTAANLRPTYEWRKDGNPLQPSNRIFLGADGTLEIRNFQSSDAGTYTIVATNSVGSDSDDIQVTLARK